MQVMPCRRSAVGCPAGKVLLCLQNMDRCLLIKRTKIICKICKKVLDKWALRWYYMQAVGKDSTIKQKTSKNKKKYLTN